MKNMIRTVFILFCCGILFTTCKNIETDVNNVMIQMNVAPTSGSESSAHGYPIYMHLSVSGSQPSIQLYVHIFQRINGGQYYYQSSAAIAVNGSYDLPAYLGGLSDIHQNYEVYAIVNNDKDYYKDSNGIYRVSSLPQYQKAAVLVYRER